ncbi:MULTISPECIES: hypothetical protein [Streptomyces]|uniref:hypothetical protein n=1 Tax=Streptomyces TaxID=1883 RepID=UPI002E2C5FEB|nr:hypothetical protein [Streptomyces sp. NBC_00271]
MYVLIVPASTPLVLLATMLGLFWWGDRILPPAEPVDAPAEAPFVPAAPAQIAELPRFGTALTTEVAGR